MKRASVKNRRLLESTEKSLEFPRVRVASKEGSQDSRVLGGIANKDQLRFRILTRLRGSSQSTSRQMPRMREL